MLPCGRELARLSPVSVQVSGMLPCGRELVRLTPVSVRVPGLLPFGREFARLSPVSVLVSYLFAGLLNLAEQYFYCLIKLRVFIFYFFRESCLNIHIGFYTFEFQVFAVESVAAPCRQAAA